MMITGKTKLLGILGYPLTHSLSFGMQQAALSALDINACYLPFLVPPEQLSVTMAGLRALDNFLGANVTIPHKEAMLTLCDEIDDASLSIGAVNVIVKKAGKLWGHNTDWSGFLTALSLEGVALEKGGRVLVLGAGGGARAVTYALLSRGCSIFLYNRHVERAEQMVCHFSRHGKVEGVKQEALGTIVEAVDVIVNTTPCGMAPSMETTPFDGVGIDQVPFTSRHVVVDIVYNPRETKLLQIAREKGAKGIGGLGMLVHQGAEAFQYFTGQEAPISLMQSVVERAL